MGTKLGPDLNTLGTGTLVACTTTPQTGRIQYSRAHNLTLEFLLLTKLLNAEVIVAVRRVMMSPMLNPRDLKSSDVILINVDSDQIYNTYRNMEG